LSQNLQKIIFRTDPKELRGPFRREKPSRKTPIFTLLTHIDITPGLANQKHVLSHLASCGFDNPMFLESGLVGNFLLTN
jgi:hypothetical protein